MDILFGKNTFSLSKVLSPAILAAQDGIDGAFGFI